ncbi:unnamed protein product [Clavelina lepadiformis]|uniref:Uncharacterized protein n=1 Tax=Clavelina lepadiformis TaxID=159417 RepID=A0ABP0F3W4_CLALP
MLRLTFWFGLCASLTSDLVTLGLTESDERVCFAVTQLRGTGDGQCACSNDDIRRIIRDELGDVLDSIDRLQDMISDINCGGGSSTGSSPGPSRDPCNPDPCSGQGVCRRRGNNNFLCQCNPGFVGLDCSASNAGSCAISVGITDSRVPDSAITASSIYSHHYEAHYGRLNRRVGRGQAWFPARPYRAGEWIQVDLAAPRTVVAVATQGSPRGHWWVTSYKVNYKAATSLFQAVSSNTGTLTFQGNRDSNTVVRNNFAKPVTSRYFRLVVQTWHREPGLRLDYFTCQTTVF